MLSSFERTWARAINCMSAKGRDPRAMARARRASAPKLKSSDAAVWVSLPTGDLKRSVCRRMPAKSRVAFAASGFVPIARVAKLYAISDKGVSADETRFISPYFLCAASLPIAMIGVSVKNSGATPLRAEIASMSGMPIVIRQSHWTLPSRNENESSRMGVALGDKMISMRSSCFS